MPKTGTVSDALNRIRAGDSSAVSSLMPLVYDELRALAGSVLSARNDAPTLEPTAVVNEAFLKLVRGIPVDWESRAHFFAVAAHAIRQIVADHARKRRSEKRGGEWQRVTITAAAAGGQQNSAIDALALDEALRKLEQIDPRQAQVIELRVLAGMTIDETALVLGVSTSSVERDWMMGKMWLRRELAE